MRLYVRMQTTIKCVKALKLRANIITSARKVHLGSPTALLLTHFECF
jgi:hypothetical protein